MIWIEKINPLFQEEEKEPLYFKSMNEITRALVRDEKCACDNFVNGLIIQPENKTKTQIFLVI